MRLTNVDYEFSNSQVFTGSQLRLCTVSQSTYQQGSHIMRGTSGSYVLSNSGNCSPSGSLLGYGSSTKLNLTCAGAGGTLFSSRYSSSHKGIASSSACTSKCVLATVPRYTVVKLGDASSEMRTAVCAGK